MDEARRNGWKILAIKPGSCVEEVSCPEGDWYYHVDARIKTIHHLQQHLINVNK